MMGHVGSGSFDIFQSMSIRILKPYAQYTSLKGRWTWTFPLRLY